MSIAVTNARLYYRYSVSVDVLMKTVREFGRRAIAPSLLGLLVVLPAHAAPLSPIIDFTVNGQTVVSIPFTQPGSGNSSFAGSVSTADYDLQYSIDANAGAFISYEFTVEDLSGIPLTFADQFSTSVSAGLWDLASSSLNVLGIPGPSGGFALTTGSGPFMDVQATGNTTFDLGVALGANCPALTNAGSCYSLQTQAAIPRQTLSSLDVYTDFTLDGLDSAIKVNGIASLSAPEPGSWMPIAAGVLLTALAAQRSRRRLSPAASLLQ